MAISVIHVDRGYIHRDWPAMVAWLPSQPGARIASPSP